MVIPYLMLNQEFACFIITMAGQSILVSVTGTTIIKLFKWRPAPVRSLICAVTIAALGLVFIISIGFHLSGISLHKAYLPVSVKKNRQAEVFPMETDTILLSPSTLSEWKSDHEKEMLFFTREAATQSKKLTVLPLLLINIMGLIWLMGIMFHLLKLCYGVLLIRKFRKGLSCPWDIPFYGMVRNIAGIFQKDRLPKIYSSPIIKSPIAIGLFNPIVIIPEKLFKTISENELKSILLHELSHIYHYDQVTGVIKRLVIALYWWNPLVYLISSYHGQAREEISDNYVLCELHPAVYIKCLMNLAEKACLINNLPTASGMAGSHFNLKKRAEQILSKKRSVAMRTKLYLKTITFAFSLVLTFGIAGLHGKVQTESTAPVIKSLQAIIDIGDPYSIIEEENDVLSDKNIEPDHGNYLSNSAKAFEPPEKQAKVRVLENEYPAVFAADAVIRAENKTEKQGQVKAVLPSSDIPAGKTLEAVRISKSWSRGSETESASSLKDASTAIKNEDYKTAGEILFPLVEENNKKAQTILGIMYFNGQGVKQDISKGISWIMEAADQGFEPARIIALNLNMDLGSQGDTDAMYNAGYMCLNGWGGEQDIDVCLNWLKSAGKLGHEKSSKLLARIYTRGMFGVTPDEKEVIYWKNLPGTFTAGIDGKWEGEYFWEYPHRISAPDYAYLISIKYHEYYYPIVPRSWQIKYRFSPEFIVPIFPGRLNGKWSQKYSFEFKTNGDKLTGKIKLLNINTELEIEDGKVDGDNFSFTAHIPFPLPKGGTMNFAGRFFGDELNLTYIAKPIDTGVLVRVKKTIAPEHKIFSAKRVQ